MHKEITAAVLFLVQLIERSKKFSPDQLACFQQCLVELLIEKFENHWFPEQPFKGQGYRCIRVNELNRKDISIERAANAAGVRYEDLSLPVELTLWVDPKEVCYRFGESKGSYCILASFNDKEKIIPVSNIIENIDKEVVEEKEDEKSTTQSTNVNQPSQKSKSPLSNQNSNSTSGKKRSSNSPRLHTNRNRSWVNNHSFAMNMAYNHHHPLNQPWYNVIPPHFLGGPPSPPFMGHRNSKWMHSSFNGPSRFHHWSPKATLKV